jgi:succinoglycan biosynthesis transport protein ExoP
MNSENSFPRSDNEPSRPNEIVPILIRRRWFFLAPLFTVGLLGYALANVLPLLYRSSAFIIVEQQKVPEKYVASNVLMNLQKRLDSMTQQILSRTRLQRFIEDLGLYPNERKHMLMDDVIDLMQKRVSVEVAVPKGPTTGRQAEVTGFNIIFSDRNPYVAQRVTNELASLFIEQDARERTSQSQQTTAFLEGQLEEARKELASEEEKVSEYKLKHLGELPSQQESNLRILSSLEVQLQANTAALDRADQQRIYLESLRSQQQTVRSLAAANPATSETGPDGVSGAAGPASTSLTLAEATLADLWRQLHDLTAKFTDKHPDVVRLTKEISDWEATVQRLKTAPMANAEVDSRLKATLAEVETERRESNELRRRIREVQGQLSQIPVREQEMAELTRQYDNAKANFQSLLQKKLGSQLSTNLEERQGGEQFRLLDAASVPKKPEGRQKIVIVGWVLAFAVGAGLTFLREMLDRSVHKQADLEDYQRVPILARIPTLRIEREERRDRFRRRIELTAVACMVLISVASGLQTFLQG